MSIQPIIQQALQTGILSEPEKQMIQTTVARQNYSIEDSHALSDLYRALLQGNVQVTDGRSAQASVPCLR